MRAWRHRLAGALSGAWHRVAAGAWPVLQQTGAAVASWVIAKHVIHHHQPIFAPIATVVGLNASRGERGGNAVRLLLGVALGILAAEAATALLGHRGYATLALAVFTALMVAVAFDAQRIVIAQAAVAAIIAVATGRAQAGTERLTDAAVGVAVALIVSQLLLPAEPVALLRRAEAAALTEMADALDLGVGALETGDAALADRAVEKLQQVGNDLSRLRDVRVSSRRSARRSPIWWTRVTLVKHESEAAGHLQLLGSGCLALTRIAIAAHPARHRLLSAVMRRLAEILDTLARSLGDEAARRRTGEQALALVGELTERGHGEETAVQAAQGVLWGIAVDILVFSGTDEQQALDAVLAVARPSQE